MLQQSFVRKPQHDEKMTKILEARIKEVEIEKKNYFNDLKESVKGNGSVTFKNAYDDIKMAEIQEIKNYIKGTKLDEIATSA